jgi:multiple sugar transport system substrate-binding protein
MSGIKQAEVSRTISTTNINESFISYRGLTWDHPRGSEPLKAANERFEREHGFGLIGWEKQPLEGFEAHPILDLTNRFDLVVLDHPHIGEAVAHDCLLPLDAVFDVREIDRWKKSCVGRALESYQWQGKFWALPIDVAAQVAAYRADQIDALPDTWDDVIRLSERHPVVLSCGGPHSFLTLLSICAALGEQPEGDRFLSDAVVLEALTIMRTLYANGPTSFLELNPIQLLEVMAKPDAGHIAFIPLIFGYVNYAKPAANRAAIRFGNAPRAAGRVERGSVLGGTGLAISSRTTVSKALLDHLRWLVSDEAQTRFFPCHQGQPSARAAWNDEAVNREWGGFYRATSETIGQAIVRPRYDGYIDFQTIAAGIVRAGLDAAIAPDTTLDRLRVAWRRSVAQVAGPLSNPNFEGVD